MREQGGPEGVLTLVCLTCGNERFFTDQPPAEREVCSRCGSTVFRRFFTPTTPDEATESFLEDSGRSMALGEGSPDISEDDVRDLDNP